MAKQNGSSKKTKKGQSRKYLLSLHRVYIGVAVLTFILAVSGCLITLEPATLTITNPSPTPSPTPTAVQPSYPATNPDEISRGDRTRKQVIFTFDGGSGDGSTGEILEALKKHNVKGTFFFTGGWVKENPEWTRKIVAAGHEVFNHSYSHPYFTQLSDVAIQEELKKFDDLLFETADVRTQPYYRAPYGDRNARVNAAAFAAGYQHIYWSVDSLDWRPGETEETIWNRVMPNIHNGAIVLMHVGNPTTGKIIDRMFTTLREQGYELNSLTEGL